MKNDYNLEFLRSKINQTGTALCTLCLPGCTNTSYIIHTESVDENGNISFSLVNSLPKTTPVDLKSFGIKLLYYKKGLGFYLNIDASASATHTDTNHRLNVKAKMLSAEYSEGVKNFKLKDPELGYSFRRKISQMAAGLFWM